jgi:hypothetical protein
LSGSSALKKFIFSWREPRDIDYIVTSSEYSDILSIHKEKIVATIPNKRGFTVHMLGSIPIEYEIAKDGNSTELLLNILIGFYGKNNFSTLNPREIYTLKMSHRFLKNSPHFKKTMDDIILLRKLGFGEIPYYLKDWFKIREKETYDYNHPKLKKVGKDDFFDTATGINYEYDHDSIHESVAHFSRPAFTMIKDDPTDVFCSKEKFNSLPETLKLFTVLEEAYTLALERHQIPNHFTPDPRKSFEIALMKVCTSISSGWWREYAWENYYNVSSLYDEGYIQKFQNGLKNGIVKPYEGK